jgi:hypothetical protein
MSDTPVHDPNPRPDRRRPDRQHRDAGRGLDAEHGRPATRAPGGTPTAGDPSPLDAAGTAFRLLVTGPRPLGLDGRTIAGLPDRDLAMDEVADLLLQPGTGYAIRDRVWTLVVHRARELGPDWTIAAVGLALPRLRRIAAHMARSVPAGQVADLESELLTGFLTALRDLDPAPGRIAARLTWAAYRAADRYRNTGPARCGVVFPLAASVPPPRPWGHPDFVLAQAVADRVLSSYEAELIAATRLEAATLDDLARRWGLPRTTLSDDRARAEARLVRALHRAGKVTIRSRSAAVPDSEGPDPDSEDARASCPTPDHPTTPAPPAVAA